MVAHHSIWEYSYHMNRDVELHIIEKGLLVSGVLLVLLTFFTNLVDHSFAGFTGLWYELDLRIEGNFATWVESVMMILATSAVFRIVASEEYQMPGYVRAFFVVMIASGLFFAADEMLSIHEMFGSRMTETTGVATGTLLEGFSWVLLYIPFLLVGLLWMFSVVRFLFKNYPASQMRAPILRYLFLGAVSTFMILLFESIEGYLYHQAVSDSIFPSFEESFEIGVILSFFYFSKSVYRLLETKEG